MESFFQFNETELLAFLLVLLRVGTFVGFWPILGGVNMPRMTKFFFGLVLSLAIFPVIDWRSLSTSIESNLIVWLGIKEIAIALVMIFITQLLFDAVHICGEIVSISMGLSSAQTLNPISGVRNSVIDQFQVMLVAVFFLSINGHHYFLSGLVDSFSIVPMGLNSIDLISADTLGTIVQRIAVMGLKLSAPVLSALFIMNVAMAIIGRAVPQINILITSFPINIMMGFLVMMVSIPALLYGFRSSIDLVLGELFSVLKSM